MEKELYTFFSGRYRPIEAAKSTPKLKGRVVKATRTEELEYAYTAPGRCIGHRSRGKTSSIVVRRRASTSETRLLLHNPRLLIKHDLFRVQSENVRIGKDGIRTHGRFAPSI